ncbi:hypothetical protein P280DRAFT_523048 [Massarina eburnea CBS 473.64]|uniref:Uncharacterized protein n=1 Tax=Massarina eburnea CBS 473.64 TaxID=1395130 RepID=A0A6A6RKF6_9PLEO|nr:hypothetical protein P280DRAFT_523048 [Massarina eburnea CBS 473.64]
MGKRPLQPALATKIGEAPIPQSRSNVVAKFKSCGPSPSDGKEVWEQTSLIVCLKFTRNVDALQSIVSKPPVPTRPYQTTRNGDQNVGSRLTGQTSGETPGTRATVGHSVEPTDGTKRKRTATPQTAASKRSTAVDTTTTKRTETPRTKSRNATPQSMMTVLTSTPIPSIEPHEPIRAFPLFLRQWKDETQNFNMKTVVASLRSADREMEPLSSKYTWFPEATPIDAILPPGVPLTAKEINAYYPHHIRWKGVMLRLVNNRYRGPELIAIQSWFRGLSQTPISGPKINQFMRDVLRNTGLPDFKTTEYKGKPDRNLNTTHYTPGRFIENQRGGLVVPTFDDLLKGLKYLPTGAHARGLTQCLVWYLNQKRTGRSELQFNVLHTQALIRALKEPLRGYGPQNLDMSALEEWKENGRFTEKKVEDEKRKCNVPEKEEETLKRPKLEINIARGSVKAQVTIHLRHVLTFPCMAMINMAAEGLVMGIKKAEMRQGMAEESDTDEEDVSPSPLKQASRKTKEPSAVPNTEAFEKNVEPAKEPTPTPDPEKPTQPPSIADLFRGYRIPKRKRVEEEPEVEPPRKKVATEELGVPPTGPRALSSTPQQDEHHTSMRPATPQWPVRPGYSTSNSMQFTSQDGGHYNGDRRNYSSGTRYNGQYDDGHGYRDGYRYDERR